MRRICPTPKRNGDQCSGNVPAGKYFCWFHDPANEEKRRRVASKAGRSKKSKLSKDLHSMLEGLTEQVILGTIDPYPASVAGQLVGIRLRVLEYERKLRETDELEEKIAQLEQGLVRSQETRSYGA